MTTQQYTMWRRATNPAAGGEDADREAPSSRQRECVKCLERKTWTANKNTISPVKQNKSHDDIPWSGSFSVSEETQKSKECKVQRVSWLNCSTARKQYKFMKPPQTSPQRTFPWSYDDSLQIENAEQTRILYKDSLTSGLLTIFCSACMFRKQWDWGLLCFYCQMLQLQLLLLTTGVEVPISHEALWYFLVSALLFRTINICLEDRNRERIVRLYGRLPSPR